MISHQTGKAFRNLLLNVCRIWSWRMDYDGKLIETNCESPNLFFRIMLEDSHREALMASQPGDMPLIFSNNMALMFSAVFGEKEIWMLGPVYAAQVTDQDLRSLLVPYHLKEQTQADLIKNLLLVPLVPSVNLFEKTLMLHQLINDTLIEVSDFRYHVIRHERGSVRQEEQAHSPLIVEQALLDHVRKGNLNYQRAFTRAATASPGIRVQTGNPIRQAKYSVVAFITLCCRAAIEGGLPADTAYMLQDNYTTNLDSCKTYAEVAVISHTMYDDYVRRVHRHIVTAGRSRGVQLCCDNMEMHLTEEITLEGLARHAGYSTYYLSRKFKQEMGMAPAFYLQKLRLEEAARLLSTTRTSVQEISEHLHFCSRSYFTEVFTREVGISPAAYREKHMNI